MGPLSSMSNMVCCVQMLIASICNVVKFAALMVLMIGNISAYADTPVSTRTLIAALAEADYPPFYFKQEERLAGISIDVLKEISPPLGIEIEYRRLSWPRVLKSLETGDVDLVTTFFNTAERAPYVVYTGVPHAFESSHFFTLPQSNLSYSGDLQSLRKYIIGMIRGYSYGKVYDSAEYLKKEPVLDEPTLVRMMLANRFDLAVGNPYAIRLQASLQGRPNGIRFLQPAVDNSPIYMAVSRQHPKAFRIVSELSSAISDLKKTQAYRDMLDRYDLPMPDY